MPHVDVHGLQLNYRIDGRDDAPVVLFSNSLGTDLAMWDAQIPALAADFCCLRYDSRGHGASDVPPGPYTLDQLAWDAVGLLDALGIERVHFVGLSKGGAVGQALGARHADRLLSLTLCATAAQLPPREMWDQRIAAVEGGGMEAVADAVVERWLTEGFRREHRAETTRIKKMILATSPDGYVACAAAVRDLDLRPELSRIAVRTLLFAGTDDPATPPASLRAIQEQIAGAELVELEPAAHLLNIEQAKAFNARLAAWLGA